jgi:hypothetical protein
MSADILEMVILRAEIGQPATLSNYRRAKIAGEAYPGILPEVDSKVNGCLYKNISLADLKKLDIYEGEIYHRILVEVDLEQPINAYTYVLNDRFAHLLTNEEWSYDHFIRYDQGNFIRTYSGWT